MLGSISEIFLVERISSKRFSLVVSVSEMPCIEMFLLRNGKDFNIAAFKYLTSADVM